MRPHVTPQGSAIGEAPEAELALVLLHDDENPRKNRRRMIRNRAKTKQS